MIDWMIQVLRVLNQSNDKTFFRAVSILDKFFSSLKEQEVVLNKNDLHKYGLVSIYIASKLEDEYTLSMEQIINEAGHNKFNLEEIIEGEKNVLQALNFRLNHETPFDIAYTFLFCAL